MSDRENVNGWAYERRPGAPDYEKGVRIYDDNGRCIGTMFVGAHPKKRRPVEQPRLLAAE